MKNYFLGVWLILLCGLNNVATADTIASAHMEDMALYLFQIINGTSDARYAGDRDGPGDDSGRPTGFMGMIRSINSNDGLGGGLEYCFDPDPETTLACSAIPTTGDCTMDDGGRIFKMYFETPTKVIPAGYTGADGSAKYDRRVRVTVNGILFMKMEFNCGTSVGWLRFASPEDSVGGATTNARHMEIYYDTNTAAATKLEMAMYYNQAGGDDEYFQAKFQTDSASTFDLWLTRSAEESGAKHGFRVGMRGNSSTKAASVFMLFQNDNNWNNTGTGYADNNQILTSAGTGDVMCIDYSGTPSAVDGSCAGLNMNAPGSLLINSAGDMSINSTVTDIQSAMTPL